MVLLGVGQLAQHIIQVILDHQVMPMGTADHAVYLHAAWRRIGMAEELPVFAAYGQRANRSLRLVIVDRNVAIAEILPQRRPLIPQVAAGSLAPLRAHRSFLAP